MADYHSTNTSAPPTPPTTPEDRMRSAIVDALRELENRVVPALVDAIELEHELYDHHACASTQVRYEIATRRTARVLGSIAAIMVKIQEAAK